MVSSGVCNDMVGVYKVYTRCIDSNLIYLLENFFLLRTIVLSLKKMYLVSVCVTVSITVKKKKNK